MVNEAAHLRSVAQLFSSGGSHPQCAYGMAVTGSTDQRCGPVGAAHAEGAHPDEHTVAQHH